MQQYFGFMDFSGPDLIIILGAVLVLAFEVVMFVDVVRNQYLPLSHKLLWAAGMLLFHPIIAIIYYFLYYRKHGRS
jgi:hypothetical protein